MTPSPETNQITISNKRAALAVFGNRANTEVFVFLMRKTKLRLLFIEVSFRTAEQHGSIDYMTVITPKTDYCTMGASFVRVI